MNKILLLLLFLATAIPLRAQRIQFRNFNVREGLAQSQVYDVTEDKKGRLWLATRGGGISIYNGIGFENINHRTGLSNNYVHCFAKDKQQNIWIGTNDGLNKYDGKTITKFYPENLGEQVWLLKIAIDDQQRIWAASKIGLLKFENGKFENISEQLGLAKIVCNAVYVDSDRYVYWGNDLGLFRIPLNGPHTKAEKISLPNTTSNISITKLYRTKSGKLLAASYGYGLFVVENGQLARVLEPDISKQEKILDLYEDKQILYVATLDRGVIAYNFLNNKVEQIDVKKGLSNNHVRSIYKDRTGNLWFGTSGGGVSNYGGQLFTHFDKSNGLPDNFVYAILQRSNGELLIGAGNHGLTSLQKDSVHVYDAAHGFLNTKVKSIRVYDSAHILVGTEGEGLFIYAEGQLHFVNSLGRQFIKDIAVDNAGNIWVATAGNGIYRLKPESLAYLQFDIRQFIDFIINPRVQYLNTQFPGKVYYCTENQGIGLIENEQETGFRLNTRTGIYSNLTRNIAISKSGIAWIGTSDKGLSAYDLKQNRPIRVDNTQLPSLNIYLLQIDSKGNLIIGTERGLAYVELNTHNQIAQVKQYGKDEGFLGIETCLNAISANADGSYWIGTIDGLTLYNPAKGTVNANPPLLSLRDIKLFYKSISQTKYATKALRNDGFASIQLPYSQNHVTFDFEGINLGNGAGVKYKWKLDGFDEQWSPVSNQHSVTYSNLPPGAYTLLVMSCNEDGVWNKQPLKYSFDIAKPFWLLWWFIAIVVALIVLLLWRIVQWRTNKIKKEALEKQRELGLANQLQVLEHKALRLQMNPHFIFNALNSIQSQIGNNNDKEARYYIAKFGKLMRQILNHSEQTWVNVSEELEIVENYLLIEQFCHNKQFKYELEVAPELVEEEYKIPSMIIQPFIENAIKHGFRNLKDREALLKLGLKLSEDKKAILCSIEDNGVGRSQKEKPEEVHHSMAIGITQRRLQLLHENMNEQFLTITDLMQNSLPSGTRVDIVLPVQ